MTRNDIIQKLERFANGRKQYIGVVGDYYINYNELIKLIQSLK